MVGFAPTIGDASIRRDLLHQESPFDRPPLITIPCPCPGGTAASNRRDVVFSLLKTSNILGPSDGLLTIDAGRPRRHQGSARCGAGRLAAWRIMRSRLEPILAAGSVCTCASDDADSLWCTFTRT